MANLINLISLKYNICLLAFIIKASIFCQTEVTNIVSPTIKSIF